MVDASYGTGPSNSNISEAQVSGKYLLVVNSPTGPSQFPGASQSGGQNFSGIYTANVPYSESTLTH